MIWLLVILFPLLLSLVAPAAEGDARRRGALLSAAALPALLAGLAIVPVETAAFPGLFLGAEFGLDTPRGALLTLAALLWGIAGAFAGAYLRRDAHPVRFAFFFLLAMSGTFGLIVAQDVPSFYTCFVVMTFASYPLVIHTATPEARRAGRIYLVMAVAGELFLIFSLYGAVQAADSLLLVDLAPAVADAENGRNLLLLGLIGFGVKAGAVPLYFWLPLAHPVAPTPASAVLSGVMIKAGLLGWLHLAPLGQPDPTGWAEMLIVLGLLAAFGAAAIGFFQEDPKTTLAYSSISQMGLMTVLLGLGMKAGASEAAVAGALALYAFNHGLAKGALFLGTGVVAAVSHGRLWVMAGLATGAIGIAGGPLTGGALAKYGLKETASLAPSPWENLVLGLLPFATLATSLLLGRFLWLCWKKPGSQAEDSPAGLVLPWALLTAAALILPWWLNPYLGLDVPVPAFSFAAWFEATWPLVAAGAILLVALRLSEKALPCLPPGDFIVPIERLVSMCGAAAKHAGLRYPARGSIDLAALSDRLLALEDARELMDRAEARLSRWRVVGALFILIALGFILAAWAI